jgi:hypothetical protein
LAKEHPDDFRLDTECDLALHGRENECNGMLPLNEISHQRAEVQGFVQAFIGWKEEASGHPAAVWARFHSMERGTS